MFVCFLKDALGIKEERMREKKNIIRIDWIEAGTGIIYSYRYAKPHTFKELRSYFMRFHKPVDEPLFAYRVIQIEIV